MQVRGRGAAVTLAEVQALRAEAAEAGDLAAVQICDRALAPVRSWRAWSAVERIVREARARRD